MNTKKFIEKCQIKKLDIINIWMENEEIKDIISSFELDNDIIKKRYSFAVLDYYLDFLGSDKTSGNSTIVIDFLKYLKKFAIKSNDLYVIYESFKDSLLIFSYNENLKTDSLSKKITQSHKKIFYEILTAYEKSNSQLEKILNKSIDIVDKYVLMLRANKDGYITSVSNAFCQISGYRDFELIGKKYTILLKDEFDIKELENSIKLGNTWNSEVENIKKNGEIFWLKTTIHPNFDNIGNLIGFDAIYQDITSSIDLKNHQNILIEQSKSAAMGEMISMIAHQWRQPLQAVSILVQKLSIVKMIDGEITDEMLDEVVQQVVSQLNYMSKTIDDFRDYFKPNKKRELVLISEVIEKQLTFLEYLFKINNIEILYENSSNTKIELFLNEIVQVLISLSKNSCDAMIERGLKDRFINIKTYEKNSCLLLEFEDSAGGIKEEILSRIFDPYFSTKANKNGTGLGLYMCKQIIEKHSKGEISVENTKLGSKFTIKLPLK